MSPRALLACAFATTAVVALPNPDEAQSSSRLDRTERGIIHRINKIRAQHGLPAVRSNRALSRSAEYHCKDMIRANFFAHSSSNGQSFFQRVVRFRPSRRIGETLAYVPTKSAATSRRIVQLWMNSPPHRASLLNGGFRRIGVARRAGTIGTQRVVVFTADFASAR